ncbi:hypothetical protein EYF80_038370 [Liparis tanakae]|uniref:Uncharacterized protein n=1 Tax=Liparis tanakae TaxID=230148 RepID=A0A4Z2GCV1_9TELE|nr:hypothetical protein EYF80_038370 [Liparis tanakae]
MENDEQLSALKETRVVEQVVLAPPLGLHDQLRLAERVRGGGVGRDRLDDDAVAGAEAVRLRRRRRRKRRRRRRRRRRRNRVMKTKMKM